MKIAIVGGTGKTGRAVADALERRSHAALPLGRSSWGDLSGALTGCDAVYLIAPNFHRDEPGYVAQVLAAMAMAGVTRVVYHSVASPYLPAMSHHLDKARAEDVVRRSDLAWTILQPGPYLQNFDLTRPVTLPYRADAPFGFADLDDVAEVAALVLSEAGHEGATYELASRQATVAELAAEADVPIVVQRPVAAPRDREEAGLHAMFAYYDDHGLLVGTRTMAALLGR